MDWSSAGAVLEECAKHVCVPCYNLRCAGTEFQSVQASDLALRLEALVIGEGLMRRGSVVDCTRAVTSGGDRMRTLST